MNLLKTIYQQFFSNNKSNKAKAILPVDQYTNNEKEYNEPAANIAEKILITEENLLLYNELNKIIEENKALLKILKCYFILNGEFRNSEN